MRYLSKLVAQSTHHELLYWLTLPTDRVLITSVMARVCELCGKGSIKGNLVPRGIGRRVTRRIIRRQHPNLRTVRMVVGGGNKVTLRICASCLKRMKKDKKAQVEETASPEVK